MKKFSQYLTESTRNYEYIIKFAGVNPNDDMLHKISDALDKYNLVSMLPVKSLPIRQHDKDFPSMENPEVYTTKIQVTYPAPAEFIRHTIASLGLAFQDVYVATGEPNGSLYFPYGPHVSHEACMQAEEDGQEKNTTNAPILSRQYDIQDNEEISGDHYGTDYNHRLIKNSIGSTEQMIPKAFKDIPAKFLGDDEVGLKSAMGSTKTKIPTVRSFAR